MKCGNCTFWENDICYRKGTRVGYNTNCCEHYVTLYVDTNKESDKKY